ncbi:LPXTG cell wall anchor domain-containing protein [Streptococcus peroris]|uniref:LPXTG-motif cell wall anchor domain protein n=1 Tax=Streptococcus peroris ATCC 700780 TaxID=888746 RepID=E8KBG0_9STRE|nr:LPXTG cell wall anchor domain-containing protein [Streptococcus peroris]EFX40584.1 LPXTG-motif cell wall anchor domain protein [Streptococcus peroris ATCC 700780]
MKKLTKLGVASFSIFVLNVYSQTIVKADENVNTSTPVALASSAGQANSSSSSTSSVNAQQDGNSTVASNVTPTTEEATSTSNTANTSVSENGRESNTRAVTPKNGNIIDEGGYVNVEGQPAFSSEDGKNVTYSYTVAYQAMHSSDHGQSVSDLAIRIPNLPNAKVDFTLVGTRDAKESPISVNVPMKLINFDDENRLYPTVIPRAEELEAGKIPFIVGFKGYGAYGGVDESKITSYSIFTVFSKSQAVRVNVTLPLEEAKKIKYLPIDTRMDWKSSQEGGGSYEEGSQNLQDYKNHQVGVYNENGEFSYGGLENPSLIDDSYVQNGHLIRSVSNPSTYITPNNGDWTRIPHDININPETFFNYVKTFNLKYNPVVSYYASEFEDMADQDVSAFYQGNVLVDYVIKDSSQSIKSTYTDTPLTSIYGMDGALKTYDISKNNKERPEFIIFNGQTYHLVGVSTTSAPEYGLMKEGTTQVVYEYVKEELSTVTPAPTFIPPVIPAQKPVQSSQNEDIKVNSIEEQSSNHKEISKPQLDQDLANQSEVSPEQGQLPNTGNSNTPFFSFLGSLVGIFGFALLKKRKSER